MATYCYRDPDTTELVDKWFSAGTAPESIVQEDGRIFLRCREAEWASQGGASPQCWPMVSDAVGCHPSQRKEYQDFSIKQGVPTEFNQYGQAVFRDRAHRKAYLKLVGAVDYAGGYGDNT